MPPKAVSNGPAPSKGDGQENEDIRALRARVEELGERDEQRETKRLRREAEQAAREEATAAKLDQLIGAFALMQQHLGESRGRASATPDVQRGGAPVHMEVQPGGVALHPHGETGYQPTPPSSPQSSTNSRRQDPEPMAASDQAGDLDPERESLGRGLRSAHLKIRNPVFSGKKEDLEICSVSTDLQDADLLTKALTAVPFMKHRKVLLNLPV